MTHTLSSFGRGAGHKLITATQSLADFEARMRSDPRYPRSHVRRFLSAHGLRGAVLRAELDRITNGYMDWVKAQGEGFDFMQQKELPSYPYGWRKPAMTRLMKRMFHGMGREQVNVILDEFYYFH